MIDFGENMGDYVEFTVSGASGDEVSIVLGEVLDSAGNFTMRNFHFDSSPETPIHCLKQEIYYVLSGKGQERYKPSFAFMGFRYALVEQWPGEVDPDHITAIVICSDMEQTVMFDCSDELMNRLYENTLRSQQGNFIDLPTDCPHRERMGWTGDAQLFCRTGATNYDAQAFFTKWLRDMVSAQKEDGGIPNTIPFESRAALSNTDDTDDADERYIWNTGFHWGEWLEPGKSQAEAMREPKDETATAYFAQSAEMLSKIAAILGKTDSAAAYGALARRVKQAYVHRFTEKGAIHGGDRQCLYVRPLALHLLPVEMEQEAADTLNEIVIKNDYRIGTGFLSTPFLCEVLTLGGHLDTAYKMLLNRKIPG